jgi:glycosyltransferase involved in cell wall biosynthesis
MWMSRGNASILLRIKTALNFLKDTPYVAWKMMLWKSDIVYSNTVTVCVGAFAARLLGRPHVWHLHEFGMEDQGLSFIFGKRLSLGLVNRLSKRCICVSNVLAQSYRRSLPPPMIHVIYPSVPHTIVDHEDDDHPFPSHTGRFRCLIVGALIEGKGQEDAILALTHLREAGIEIELIIVGEGEPAYRRRLEKLVEVNKLTGSVIFAGVFRSAFPAMQSSDAVLICSRSEAFGRVTIEAMLAGKPVIGARSGATAELIHDGQNGLLYAGRDPKDLADRIKYLHDNPKAAFELGRTGRRWVEQTFTPRRFTNEILALLTSLPATSAH